MCFPHGRLSEVGNLTLFFLGPQERHYCVIHSCECDRSALKFDYGGRMASFANHTEICQIEMKKPRIGLLSSGIGPQPSSSQLAPGKMDGGPKVAADHSSIPVGQATITHITKLPKPPPPGQNKGM